MLRTLPYPEGLVAGYLRETLPGHYPGVLVATELPAVSVRTYPLVVVSAAATSGGTRHATLAGRAVLDVQTWTRDHKRGCADLAETVRNLIYRLWADQVPRPEGRVALYTEQAAPAQIPSDDTAAPWRYQALYAVRLRS